MASASPQALSGLKPKTPRGVVDPPALYGAVLAEHDVGTQARVA